MSISECDTLVASLHVPQNGSFFEPVHFKKRFICKAFSGSALT